MNSSQPVLLTTIIILFFDMNKNVKETKELCSVKVTSNYSKMPFIFRFYVDNYGINSAQTNKIMTTACVIVKIRINCVKSSLNLPT